MPPSPTDIYGAVLTRPSGSPEFTLAWQILEWTTDYLLQPDGPDAGGPFIWTPEQVKFLEWFYAVDRRGRWLYPKAVFERMKGHGKDPLGCAVGAVEFAGPCRFGGWNASGEPVGIIHTAPWVQVAAVSKDQTGNTMSLFPAMFSDRAISEFGIDLGKEIIYGKKINAKIEAVTSSPRSLEGKRSTCVVRNETHHWLSNNEGHAMMEVTNRNIAKARGGGARMLDITNAHEPGEDSVAEQVWDGYRKVAALDRGGGPLYDSREAPADVDLGDPESLRAGLIAARGDSLWLDVDGLIEVIYDPITTASQARRFYLNQKVSPESAWANAQKYDVCKQESMTLELGDEVTLGFDGSKTDDSTVLVAVRLSDGFADVVKAWENDGIEGWRVDTAEVDDMIGWAFGHYSVAAFYADVAEWESYVDKWSLEYGAQLKAKATAHSAVGWDMRGRLKEGTRAAESLLADITEGKFLHNGNEVLRRHILNAKRRANQYGWTFGKQGREGARKVDALAATILARIARQDVLVGQKPEKPPHDGRAWIM